MCGTVPFSWPSLPFLTWMFACAVLPIYCGPLHFDHLTNIPDSKHFTAPCCELVVPPLLESTLSPFRRGWHTKHTKVLRRKLVRVITNAIATVARGLLDLIWHMLFQWLYDSYSECFDFTSLELTTGFQIVTENKGCLQYPAEFNSIAILLHRGKCKYIPPSWYTVLVHRCTCLSGLIVRYNKFYCKFFQTICVHCVASLSDVHNT